MAIDGGCASPQQPVRSLLAACDEHLWIGTNEGLAGREDGKLTQYPEHAGQSVLALPGDHKEPDVPEGELPNVRRRATSRESGRSQEMSACGFGKSWLQTKLSSCRTKHS